jgi:hypothetical protein
MTQHINPGTDTTNEYIITEFQLKQLQDFASLEFICQAIKKRPHTPAHPPEAQQRVDAMNELMAAIENRFEDTNNGRGVVGTIRNLKDALLQAGRK